MSSIKESAKKVITKYKKQIENENFNVHEINLNQYDYEFSVDYKKEKIKLKVFFGKKGIKTVLQGNKESKLYEKINQIVFGKTLFENTIEEIIEPKIYIGTDESGKGDYFGPLIIAGVLVDEGSQLKLKNIGVKDSKKIKEKNILILSKKIKQIIGDKYNIISITPKTYNQLYKKIGNVNKILGWAHAKVIENILEKNKVAEAISDKFGNESLINDSLQDKGKKIKLQQVTKAERYTAVAAASILARNKFNEWFKIQNKKLKTVIPKGASDLTNAAAAKIKNTFGEEVLQELVKVHFKNSKKIL